MPNFIDITGKRFGKLVVIKQLPRDKNKHILWECLCDCGNTRNITKNHLIKLVEPSCGCSNGSYIHGLNKTRFHNIFRSMHARCENPNNDSYNSYGAIGISVCERWKEFINFRDDMYESYLAHVAEHTEKNTQLDRINPKEDYSPANCRWATTKEQAINKKTTIVIEYNGVKKPLVEWAEYLGVDRHLLWDRIYRHGWTVEKAFTTPKKKGKLC